MDKDQIKGKLQNAFGKTEEAVGEAIGSKNLSNAGAEDRVKGAATETWGSTKETVRNVAGTERTQTGLNDDHATTETDSVRDRIATGAERLRDSANAHLNNVKDNE